MYYSEQLPEHFSVALRSLQSYTMDDLEESPWNVINTPLVPIDTLSDIPNCSPSDLMTLGAMTTDTYSSQNSGDCPLDSFEGTIVEGFKTKLVKHWDDTDVLQWINSEAKALEIRCTIINGTNFRKLDGYRLQYMTEAEFKKRDEKYGKHLYVQLRKILAGQKQQSAALTYTMLNTVKTPSDVKVELEETKETPPPVRVEPEKNPQPTFKMGGKNLEIMRSSEVEKGKRGRPKQSHRKKKKQEKKLGRLWEFIRDLLKDERYCPSLICWENHDEGMFRFVHSDKVANLWGDKKNNREMNYEKLSRAMRYYYKSQVLLPVFGRRLVYKFGPKAVNWRVSNPNFKN